MIESVYRNEESDNNYSGSSNKIKTPKNVRQIGKIGDIFKIYVEDYVKTYARQLAENDYSERCVAVLIGEYRILDGEKDVFIYGAIEAPNTYNDGKIIFLEETWTSIYEIIKKYFTDGEIVGWYFGGASFGKEESETLLQVHLDNFAGRDKVLLTYDILEKEDNFYIYDNGALVLQPGYYIYYEKNEEMQNYMVDHKRVKNEEMTIEDRAIKEVRNKLEEKKQPEIDDKSQKAVLRLTYAAGTLMTIVALVVAVTVMNNSEKMKGLEQALNAISDSLTQEKNNKNSETEEAENIFNVDDDESTPVMNQSGKTDIDNTTTVTATPTVANSDNESSDAKNEDSDSDSDNVDEDNQVDSDDAQNNDDAQNSDDAQNNDVSTSTEINTTDSNTTDTKNAASTTIDDTSDATNKTSSDNASKVTPTPKVTPTSKITPTPKPKTTETSNTENSSTETSGQNNAVDTSKYKTYTVKEGDTIAGICMKLYGNYNNIKTIKELNQLVDEDKIEAGQKLLIP